MADHGRRRGSFSIAVIATALAIFAVAAVVLAAQGVIAFWAREENPPPPADVVTTVRSEQIMQIVPADVRVVPGRTWDVRVEGTVTRPGVRDGTVLENGATVTVVDERPVFLLAGAVPMYRDLVPGLVGDDVTQLQTALSELGYYPYWIDGEYEEHTARAVYNFYVDHGFTPVDAAGAPVTAENKVQASIARTELTFAPGGRATAVGSCGEVAQQAGGPLCQLHAGASQLVVTPIDTESSLVKTGQRVEVTIASLVIPGSIASAYTASGSAPEDAAADQGAENSGESEDQGSTATEREFVVQLDDESVLSEVAPGATGSAKITVASSAEGSLVVESVAIREDGEGALWVQIADDHQRIDVTSGLCVRGICAIEGEGISKGLSVVIPIPGTGTADDGSP